MKKQINPAIKAHLIRGAFYLLLLLAVCAIPFALAQSRSRGTAKHSLDAAAKTKQAIDAQMSQSMSHLAGTVPAHPQPPNISHTDQLQFSTADNALDHYQTEAAKQAQPPLRISPRTPLGIDCNNEPAIVIHDDGTIENGYTGNPLAGMTEVRFVDKFTPDIYPNSYTSVCLDFVTAVGGPPTYNVDIVVFDDDGPDGTPGTLLGSINDQPATTHIFVPGGQQPIWNSYDIAGLGINITSGSVYIGARWMTLKDLDVYISVDESLDHPVGFAGGYWWNNTAGTWATIQSELNFQNYRSCMIRAVQAIGGPSPTPTPTPICPPGPTPDPWTIVANYPLFSESVSVSSDGTFAYAVGGFDANLGEPTTQFNRYDPGTNTWMPLPNIPIAFYDAPSVYVPTTNSVYVFGGFNGSDAIATTQIYNITTGTWTTGADMPGARYFAGAAYYGGTDKIYVIAGFDSNHDVTNTTWEYDPLTDTWNTSRANVPTPLGGSGYSIVGQNIYMAGSRGNGNGSTIHYRYDVVADSWTPVAPVPVPILRPASAAVGTQEFLVGGGNSNVVGSGKTERPRALSKSASTMSPAISYTTTYIYDTERNSWTTGPNTNVAHSFTGGTAIANLLLVVTGFDGVTGDTNIVESSLVETPCYIPTPTPTATFTPTPTPTATATATPTPTATATATPIGTATPSVTPSPSAAPRPTPTPRPRPAPRPRPTP